jgi:hypothetical protein
MKLLDIYRSILQFAGLRANPEGYVSLKDVSTDPVLIGGLRLVIPTNEQLRSHNPGEKIVFHPLTEDIVRGESEIIKKLRVNINTRLNTNIAALGKDLLNIVASPALHARLTPEQSRLLTVVKDADEKTVANYLAMLMSNYKERSDRLYVNVFLVRGGSNQKEPGRKYTRLAVVSFPFYTENAAGTIGKCRVKDRETYRQLMEFMFPDIEVTDAYNYGSDSIVAPFLETLMLGSAKIAARINELVELYAPFIEGHEDLMFDLDWMESFRDMTTLAPMIREIPLQAGNEGSIPPPTASTPVPVSNTELAQQLHQMTVPASPASQIPVPVPPPPRTSDAGGLNFREMAQASPNIIPPMYPPQYQQQYQYQPQQQMPSWAQQPQPVQYQQYPPQQMNPYGQPPQQQIPTWAQPPQQPPYPQQMGQYPQQPQMPYPGYGPMR